MPKALSAEYYAAIRDLEELAKISMKQDWDLGSAISALSAIALAKNQVKLANLILNLDNEEEIDELLKNY
ncbi:hypothetical protein [Mucilaginibacter flavidus]|uniref:hypothetical protein n=1 Tax=Mucilaginibacter flavidus TaxID=2949309 RepID=UPI002093CE40|nr:hypothetical protein [Mucilaginibacter flavidus]MCO5950707.1 hypothetical protein [Mucilaginibacter flavidus]